MDDGKGTLVAHLTTYEFQHLSTPVQESGRTGDLYRLLSLEPSAWASLTSGTMYHYGLFQSRCYTRHVPVAEIAIGGVTTATDAEEAIRFLQVKIALFVSIAGDLKDVKRGGVVVATKSDAEETIVRTAFDKVHWQNVDEG